MDNLSPVAGLPLGWMYAAGVVCSLAMGAIILSRLFQLLFRHADPLRSVVGEGDGAVISEGSK